MSLCCGVCHEREGDDAVVIETEPAVFQSVCMACVRKLDKERLRRLDRRFGPQSFVDKLPAVPDRGFVGFVGFVTIRFSTEYTDYV